MATKVDPSDPAVRQLVYKHYRGILGKYNEKANSIVSTLPRERVRQDQGIADKLESMIRQSNQIQNNSTDAPAPAPLGNGPPPPPLPPCAGSLPAVRIASEIGARKTCEPPAAIQNAMMTKDKKPFTYTPGGLNLNEIRSPRMARRISRNAHTEDSCSPQVQIQGPASPPGPLPPAALAAMQPQIAVPVFPLGGVPPAPPPAQPFSAVPPPPPPPPPGAGVPPPPPPPPSTGVPSSPPTPGPPPLPTVSSINISPRPHDFPRPDFLSDIASHPPLRPVGQPPRSNYEPLPPPPLQVQLKPVSPKPLPDPQSTQQLPFVPKPAVEIAQQNNGPMFQAQEEQVTPPIQPVTPPLAGRTVPSTPPIQSVTSPLAGRTVPSTPPIQPVTPPLAGRTVPSTPPIQPVTPPLPGRTVPLIPPVAQSQPTKAPPTPPIQQVRAPPTPPIGQRQAATPPTPPTPSLNKSPAPWLTSKPAQKESVPPWTVRQPSVEASLPTPAQHPTSQPGQLPVTRVIPIQIEGREPPPSSKAATTSPQPYYNQVHTPQQFAATPPPQFQPRPHTPNSQQRYVQPPPNFPNYAPPPTQQPIHYAPPQYQMYQQPNQQIYSQSQPPQNDQSRTRIIPIQIESTDNGKAQPPYYSQNSCPTGNIKARSQNGDMMDGRQFQTQSSYSGNPTQSRSFRVLQKITGSDDDAQVSISPPPQGDIILVNRVFPTQASEPVSGENNGWGSNTPPIYPNYWYYPPQTPEEQQQFWEHYNAMCNYMAHMNATAMRYSPYPFGPYPYPYPPYPSDTEDYSNSSCDEMTQYGQMFKEQRQQEVPSLQTHDDLPCDESTSATEDGYEESSDSDTEVDEVQLNSIQSIRSVPDIHIYANSDDSSSEESESSVDEEPESDTTSLPHQLSVIYEESELSSEESNKTVGKDICESNSSSTSTINNPDEDENAVKVRLPLQLKFTRSENDEEVATLIVGNSQMESTNTMTDGSLIITDIVKEDSEPDITATVILRKPRKEIEKTEVTNDSSSDNNSPIDFWKELNEEGTNISAGLEAKAGSDDSKLEECDGHWEDDSSSTSVLTVKKGNSGADSLSELEAQQVQAGMKRSGSEEEDTSDSSSDEISDEKNETNEKSYNRVSGQDGELEDDEEDSVEEDSDSSNTSSSSDEESDEHSSVFDDNKLKESLNENKKENTLLSVKSFEESEEDDSGVTSDLSRHISETDTDPECGSELSKMTRCQRAATHSRLFKLLQDECEQEDAKEEYENMVQRKERLTLPLTSCNGDDSLSSSSGINSPLSPGVNERLVKELIQSLLSKKKGRHFRKLPMEKLHAAALRILQEDMDQYDTVSTSDESNFILSPVNNPSKTNPKTSADSYMSNPDTYGVNYYDYCNYYSTWGAVSNDIEPDYDIVPSKTFKILQGHGDRYSPQTVKGVPSVRCPRVPTSMNLREKLSTPTPPASTTHPKES